MLLRPVSPSSRGCASVVWDVQQKRPDLLPYTALGHLAKKRVCPYLLITALCRQFYLYISNLFIYRDWTSVRLGVYNINGRDFPFNDGPQVSDHGFSPFTWANLPAHCWKENMMRPYGMVYQHKLDKRSFSMIHQLVPIPQVLCSHLGHHWARFASLGPCWRSLGIDCHLRPGCLCGNSI